MGPPKRQKKAVAFEELELEAAFSSGYMEVKASLE
jgi:hypothetical protein